MQIPLVGGGIWHAFIENSMGEYNGNCLGDRIGLLRLQDLRSEGLRGFEGGPFNLGLSGLGFRAWGWVLGHSA